MGTMALTTIAALVVITLILFMALTVFTAIAMFVVITVFIALVLFMALMMFLALVLFVALMWFMAFIVFLSLLYVAVGVILVRRGASIRLIVFYFAKFLINDADFIDGVLQCLETFGKLIVI